MKTQILYLDPYDDSSSTRDRLRWARADHVVLVWPSYGRVLTRRLDLVLLQREARRQGARLGIVAHDPDVRDHASDLEIPVFDDLDSISTVAWPAEESVVSRLPDREHEREILHPERETTPSTGSPWRAGWMLMVILALLGLSAVVGPAAVIDVTPPTTPVTASLDVVFSEAGLPEGTLAAISSRTLQAEVQGSIRLPTRGTVHSPTVRAVGQAVFTNRADTEAVIPEGTGVRVGEAGVRFETTERALLPAGAGSSVTVPIRATQPGEVGNVGPDQIDAIEGDLGLRATVANPVAINGGASQEVAGVTAEDLADAGAALERQLVQEATAQMTGELQEGEALVPESIRIERTEESDSRPAVGEPSDTVYVEARLLIGGRAYIADELQSKAEAAIRAAADPDREILAPSIRVDLEPGPGEGRYVATIRAVASPHVDQAAISRQISGTDAVVARQTLLAALGPDSDPRIRLWPAWWPRLPFLPWRIHWVPSTGS